MGDLTSMPSDVLRSIWHYLSLPDVIRFGMTSKKKLNLTWPYYQEISMARYWPVNALNFVLPRDLSHVRTLEMYYQLKGQPDRNTTYILQRLESLKLSKLSALQKLVVDLEFPESATTFKNKLHCVKDIILKNNQLQALSWYTAEVEENFNVGQFFADHTRLSELRIQSKMNFTGLNLLTQLKSLNLSFHYNLNDDVLSEAMMLTQLRDLDVSFNDHITDQSFTKISNLTNLEKLKLKHNNSIKATSLKLLHQHPNLRELALYYWGTNEEDYTTAAVIIGQLTQLTCLQIDNYEGKYHDANFLTSLTNLLDLNISTNMDTADLANLTKLKSLTIQKLISFTKSTLPPNLEALNISAANKLTEENIETICSLSKLKSLQFNTSDFDVTIMAHWITQMTRLTELIVIPSPPKELIPALQHLPNLACLMFSSVPDDIEAIEELAKLTQLMELTYWNGYQKDLKTKLPFSVSYIGDFEDNK